MKKPISIQITVPEPCTQVQHWDEMQRVPGGRHCTQCRQTVVDFTKMTDAAFIAYVQQYPIGCGRYREDQLGYDLKIPDYKRSQSGIKWLIALVMMFFGLMKEGIAQKNSLGSKAGRTPVALSPVQPLLKAGISDTPEIMLPKPARPPVDIEVYQTGSGSGVTISAGARSVNTKYVIDGVQVSPKTSKFVKEGSKPMVGPMEPAGRRTIKGDDLPHGFRFEDD